MLLAYFIFIVIFASVICTNSLTYDVIPIVDHSVKIKINKSPRSANCYQPPADKGSQQIVGQLSHEIRGVLTRKLEMLIDTNGDVQMVAGTVIRTEKALDVSDKC